MKTLLLALAITMTFAANAFGETREIQHMREILPSIDQDTLVIFDLDNTVMEPLQTLGTDQWFHYMVKKYTDAGADQNTAIDHGAFDFSNVQRFTKVKPVEPETPQLIRSLQERGIKVMALTARPVYVAQRTIQELASIGVDFTKSPVYDHNTLIGGNRNEAYIRGIALISPHGDKGTALVTFLRQIGKAPRNIVFVDDTLKNVVSVEKALAGDPYRHTSFRYAFDDQKVALFNPAIGEVEWKYFGQNHQILNDEQALEIINNPAAP